MSDLRARVEAGAATLDGAVGSDWRSDINLTDLDLNNVFQCVLGQTFGSYGQGAAALGFSPFANEEDTPIQLGFMPDGTTDPEGRELTAAWRDYLQEMNR